jgi:hypothetical protein
LRGWRAVDAGGIEVQHSPSLADFFQLSGKDLGVELLLAGLRFHPATPRAKSVLDSRAAYRMSPTRRV